jgi:hypothetical protein
MRERQLGETVNPDHFPDWIFARSIAKIFANLLTLRT